MTATAPRSDFSEPDATDAERRGRRPLLVFTAVALGTGIPLLALSTVVQPGAPFLLATIAFALALPALVLTRRESGGQGVRRLLRDCVRLPTTWWWLPAAALALPAASWVVAARLGGAEPLTWDLAGFYVADLLVGALLVNIWEEMAWTGFFQRRAMRRWGLLSGSLVTALFFTCIHAPLAFDGAPTVAQAAAALLLVAAVAVGVRLLAGRVDAWTGGSLLTVGILHSSFNATESLLEPAYDWVRIAVTVGAGLVVAASVRRSGGD